MQEFLQKFIEEVTELMNDLEKDLLAFEKNPADNLLLESIMRSMHTLKGSGSMFGYDKIVEITHKLENIYDKIQKQKLSADNNIIDLSFTISDLIVKLLHDTKQEDKELEKQYHRTIEALNAYFTEDELHTKQNKIPDSSVKFFYIKFEPDADIEL